MSTARFCRRLLENELDEQTRKREISLAEFERDEIEEANLQAGEDEQLERDYRRMVNGRKIAETLNLVHGLTGEEEGNGAGEADRACASGAVTGVIL